MIAEPPVAPAPVVAEPTTPIKPSEALRLGRLQFPVPLRGRLFGVDGDTACAYGAIMAGYGDLEMAPVLGGGDEVDCPAWACRDLRLAVEQVVVHLNDFHGWTDDQIVGWLEGIGL